MSLKSLEMLEDDKINNEPKYDNEETGDFDSHSDFFDEFYIDGEGYEWI